MPIPRIRTLLGPLPDHAARDAEGEAAPPMAVIRVAPAALPEGDPPAAGPALPVAPPLAPPLAPVPPAPFHLDAPAGEAAVPPPAAIPAAPAPPPPAAERPADPVPEAPPIAAGAAIPPPPPAPPLPEPLPEPLSDALSATLSVTRSWWGGFEGRLTLTALRDVPDWEVMLGTTWRIQEVRDASHGGVAILAGEWIHELDSPAGAGALKAGQDASIGFTAATGVQGVLEEAAILERLWIW